MVHLPMNLQLWQKKTIVSRCSYSNIYIYIYISLYICVFERPYRSVGSPSIVFNDLDCLKNMLCQKLPSSRYFIEYNSQEPIYFILLQVNETKTGGKEEYIKLLAFNLIKSKKQVKRGDIFATITLFQVKEWEMVLKNSSQKGSLPNTVWSIVNVNDKTQDKKPVYHIASIVAIKPR